MRQRTSYPKLFKAQIVQECLLPDVSIASVALRHGINTNLVRKWIPIFRDQMPSTLPAFVPLKLETPSVPAQQALANIKISFGKQTLMVSWPTSDPVGCARFIRGLTQ
ncbi:transposase [Pseudomonas sp. S44]|uniref:IS66-like element accessory protein TnpA n=1 Tax=Pseudomonas sp. S44 TaxID=2767450 RepID=UPI00190CCFD7|nr:transposase [Pseudomonas sp. S44]MBK0057173.1 transposase [Pseudomonas sp. S44]